MLTEPPFHVRAARVGELGSPSPSDWMLCVYCDRYFQRQALRVDYLGNRDGCPFCACSGLGVAIFPWDAFESDHSPSSSEDLVHGLNARTGKVEPLARFGAPAPMWWPLVAGRGPADHRRATRR